MEFTLRDALHETVHNGGMPIKRLTDQLGVSYSYLANAANPNLEDFHFQLKHVMPLIKATGNFAVLDFLENACGRVAFVLPETSGDQADITAGLLEMGGKIGALFNEMNGILADGKIEAHEFKRVEPLFFELHRLAAQVMAATALAVKR